MSEQEQWLIVDDDQAFLQVLSRSLARQGIEAITASNHDSALDALDAHRARLDIVRRNARLAQCGDDFADILRIGIAGRLAGTTEILDPDLEEGFVGADFGLACCANRQQRFVVIDPARIVSLVTGGQRERGGEQGQVLHIHGKSSNETMSRHLPPAA